MDRINKKILQKKKEAEKAKKTIKEYFAKAKEVFDNNKDSANRYVRKARRLAMKYKIRMPVVLKRKFCKHCYSFLVAGKNCRVRTRSKGKTGVVVYYCFECKKYNRVGYGKKSLKSGEKQ